MKDESNPSSGVFPLHPGDNAGKVLTDKWLVDCLNSLQRRGKAIYMTATDPEPHGSMHHQTGSYGTRRTSRQRQVRRHDRNA